MLENRLTWFKNSDCAAFSLRRVIFAVLLCCLAAVGALACQVPVFRYALERWSPDRYNVVILTQGELSEEQESMLQPLLTTQRSGKEPLVELTKVDLKKSPDTKLENLWKEYATPDQQSLMIAMYPGRSSLMKQVAYAGPISNENVAAMIDSPIRQELIRRLTGGDSAVWILVESGDKVKDAAALEALEKQLLADTKRLVLPSAEEMEVSQSVLDDAKIKLKIGFSVLSVKRDDPREKFLLDCLLKSEPDLSDYNQEPIAFPVFGRGIVLYAVVGKGITPDVISAATSFIVGPCSCQVKEQNPGFDLLLDFDWDAAVGDTLVSVPVGTVQAAPKLLTIPPGKSKK
jgi:hypothetical protein